MVNGQTHKGRKPRRVAHKEANPLRKIILAAVVLTMLCFLLPLFFSRGEDTPPTPETDGTQLSGPQDLHSGRTLRVLLSDGVQEMDADQYLWGVVAAEMPASFELEALKAQAVAARTYALEKAAYAVSKHGDSGADVCGDHTCCQAYIAPEKAAANWGDNAALYTQKITQAIAGTEGKVMYYDGALVNAVFHSSSGTATQGAVEVWGGSVPYLVGVPSPEGDEVPNYRTDLVLTPQEFKTIFLQAYPEAVLEGDPASWFGAIAPTSSGAVGQITVGGVTLSGTKMRSLYYLRSANFTVEANAQQIAIHVTGYGHGVGMSQYGANAMATEGKTYEEILTWYYTGVTLEVYAPPAT